MGYHDIWDNKVWSMVLSYILTYDMMIHDFWELSWLMDVGWRFNVMTGWNKLYIYDSSTAMHKKVMSQVQLKILEELQNDAKGTATEECVTFIHFLRTRLLYLFSIILSNHPLELFEFPLSPIKAGLIHTPPNPVQTKKAQEDVHGDEKCQKLSRAQLCFLFIVWLFEVDWNLYWRFTWTRCFIWWNGEIHFSLIESKTKGSLIAG